MPDFGDYSVNHPDVLKGDMRLLKPAAAIRYTLNDSWLIAKGTNLRVAGAYAQFFALSAQIVGSRHYSGPRLLRRRQTDQRMRIQIGRARQPHDLAIRWDESPSREGREKISPANPGPKAAPYQSGQVIGSHTPDQRRVKTGSLPSKGFAMHAKT